MCPAEHAGHQGLDPNSDCGLGGPEGPGGSEGRTGCAASALPGGGTAAPDPHVRCGLGGVSLLSLWSCGNSGSRAGAIPVGDLVLCSLHGQAEVEFLGSFGACAERRLTGASGFMGELFFFFFFFFWWTFQGLQMIHG